VVIHGVGLRGLRGCAARRSTWAMPARPCAVHRPVVGAGFRFALIGDASLMKRPMERVAKPLREMGADVRTHDGTPPVDIGGGAACTASTTAMPVASAQVKSAILLAGCMPTGPPRDSPGQCRDHSERMLLSCGVRSTSTGCAPPASAAALAGQRLNVPGDFSSAAFFIVAGLLGAAREGLLIATSA
jgi:5-enolpyruvylshikimate-3-phosphate synthase